MKYKYLVVFLFFSFRCLCQETTPKDGLYLTKLRPIDNAIFSHDFKLFKTLFREEYCRTAKHFDTSNITAKMQYLNDIYFYAIIMSFDNKKDSAFYYIKKIILNPGFNNYDGILGDIGFVNLRKDNRWKEIETIAKKNLIRQAKSYPQPELNVRLLALNMTDQSNMLFNTDSLSALKVNRSLVDSIKNIFNNFGYPKVKNVGKEAASVPALIIAHAELSTQLKYKNIIYNEGIKGNIPGGMAGVLLDKIQVKEKGTQIYGTQYRVLNRIEGVVSFYPIIDSANLEKRRKEIGFTQSYEDYKSLVNNQFKRY